MALAAACAATLILSPTAFADGGGQISPRDPGAKRFVNAVSVPRIVEHQTALQRIATLNDTRAKSSRRATRSRSTTWSRR
jgi:hypothetical protein